MDKIYACAAEIEKKQGIKLDLLICTGDYQAVRNEGDLEHMHVPPKYRSLQTFHRYYSGEAVAPVLTLVVGGNHEASGYMQELPFGGWIAPRIYYLGHASVVSFAGLRLAGLSGIYNGAHFDMGHFERPPFLQHGAVISAYHVRSVDVFRLKQLESRKGAQDSKGIDVMISHDWPSGITDYGDVEDLLRKKRHFAEDIKKCALGNPATMTLLHQIRPRYWLASHLHCAFAALVPHENSSEESQEPEFTHFLALDKPIPGRQFLQFLDFEIAGNAELKLEYDPTWLTILKLTDRFTSVTKGRTYMPSAAFPSEERWDFRPSAEEIREIAGLFNNDFTIPENFRRTAPPQKLYKSLGRQCETYYRNPQTTEFCEKLGIQDMNYMLCKLSPDDLGMPYFVSESKSSTITDGACAGGDNKPEVDDECFFIDKGPQMHIAQEGDGAEKLEMAEESCGIGLSLDNERLITNETTEEVEKPRLVGSGIFRRRKVDIPEED